jgi:hypothetical protein
MQTFTKTSESALLPADLCVFSEAADITESILKFSPSLPLAKVLHDPVLLKYFRSLIVSDPLFSLRSLTTLTPANLLESLPQITDQPSERPFDGPLASSDRARHVILTLHSPRSSDAAATLPLVAIILSLIDLLDAKLPLRPETKAKLKARRDEVDEDLKKEANKERSEEQEENKRAAKKKAEDDKVARLSASEQKKVSSGVSFLFF